MDKQWTKQISLSKRADKHKFYLTYSHGPIYICMQYIFTKRILINHYEYGMESSQANVYTNKVYISTSHF